MVFVTRRTCKQVDQGGHAAGVDQELDLLAAARGCVGNCPGALLADVKVLRLEHVRQCGDDVVVSHGLHLLLAAAGDVGEGPASLLADALAVVG